MSKTYDNAIEAM